MKWRQRAKDNWLKNDDHNTKYFHASANQRCWRNLISRIVDGAGHVCTIQGEIKQDFVVLFQDLFTSGKPNHIERSTQAIKSQMTPTMD